MDKGKGWSTTAPNYTGPRRARPEWLTGNVPNPNESQLPVVPLARTVPGAIKASESYRTPVSFDPATIHHLSHLIRMRPQYGATLETDYLVNHCLGPSDLAEVRELVDRVVACFFPGDMKLVGSFADGTASKLYSSTITFACSLSRDLVFARLLAKEFPAVSHSNEELIFSFGKRTVRIVTGPELSNLFIKRTIFVKMYTHIVEPRLTTAMVLIIARLRVIEEYCVFLLLFRALTIRRVIPNLIGGNDDGRYKSDAAFWSSVHKNPNDIRNQWRQCGMCVAGRMSVAEIMALFVELCRQQPPPTVFCPISREAVSVPSELFHVMCSQQNPLAL